MWDNVVFEHPVVWVQKRLPAPQAIVPQRPDAEAIAGGQPKATLGWRSMDQLIEHSYLIWFKRLRAGFASSDLGNSSTTRSYMRRDCRGSPSSS